MGRLGLAKRINTEHWSKSGRGTVPGAESSANAILQSLKTGAGTQILTPQEQLEFLKCEAGADA
jgi:hypothetical protein